ncbi:MAG TPA: hypothetical protein VFV99_19265 [Kofleriaceae bacterium]|nr:hypothetical protein [Kofleriaceae bacterium]
MIATRTLMHPISLGAIALLVINDHVLKHVAPGVITGKLSDFAGLVFFPLLLAAAAEHAGIRRGIQTVIVAAIATAAAFAAIKLSASAAEIYRNGLGVLQWPFRAARAMLLGESVPSVGRVAHVVDATDLVALVALGVPIALVHRAMRFPSTVPAKCAGSTESVYPQ